MNVISLITLLMSATPEDAGQGRDPATKPFQVRLGLAAAFGAGPQIYSSSSSLWATGELAGFVELPLNRFSLRIALGLRVGSAERLPRLGANLAAELRLHLIPRFSIGLGVDGGYSAFWILESGPRAPLRPDRYDVFHVSATVTPAAVRLGEGLNHELSLSASMLTTINRVDGVLVFVRYASLF